jgi:4-hydroxy-tetrahydrodipicolinate reductase
VKLLLVGHGRMGRLVEGLAPQYGCTIAAIASGPEAARVLDRTDLGGAEMAIDFSLPDAVPVNLPRLAARGLSAVVGTTGWQEHEAELRRMAEAAGIGVLAASNLALGMHIFRRLVEEAARRFAARPDAGAFIHEAHHAAKRDAPSGTALTLEAAMLAAGYERPIDVASTRAGSIPGTHAVGFDMPAESMTLVHAVRDRAVFAHGALAAARWLAGRRGWFGVADMLGDT